MKLRKNRDELPPPPAPDEMMETAPAPEHMPPVPPRKTGKDSPPLFIKIEKYRDVVREVQKLRSYALGLRDALDALSDVEAELKNGLSVAQKTLDHFNSIISLLDAKFLKVQGLDESEKDTPEEIDKYVDNLYNHVERIKTDIKTLAMNPDDSY
ncbi:MAG: hypothetical protein ABIH52_00210 [Candidatus Aenigmatarchaeota archaeon]|nr:hypothetical protein [Nanoarchaeota archaeon]